MFPKYGITTIIQGQGNQFCID